MTKPLVTAVLIAALALAGCARPGGAGAGADPTVSSPPMTSSTAAAPSADGSLAEQLDGRNFETSGPADVQGFDLVDGSQLSIGFYTTPDGTVSFGGSAGCNSMGGAAVWDGNTVRPDEGLAQTEMACDGLMDQEAWYSALLQAGVTVDFADPMLTITSVTDPGTLSEKRIAISFMDTAVLHPDVPIGGQTWRLDGIVEGEGDSGSVSSVPLDLTASLTISRDPADGHLRLDAFDGLTWMSAPGGLDGATGEYSGSVTIEPSQPDALDEFADGTPDPLSAKSGTVRVTGGLAGDAIGCASDKPDCRVAEMSLLGGDFTFETNQDHLTVMGTGQHAGHGLTFVIDPSAPAPDLDTYLAEADNPLLGKTFELSRTFTDDGGADRKHADATLRLTFDADHITADGSCGPFTYDDVRYLADPADPAKLMYVDLGTPSAAGCVIGDDPSGPPADRLIYGVSDDELYLSTGFVAWYFRPVP